jgi:hypothetical protein
VAADDNCSQQEPRITANGKRTWALASKTDRAPKAHSRRHDLVVQSVLPITIAAALVRNGKPDLTAIPLPRWGRRCGATTDAPMVEEPPPR